jgi:ABC-2 type transport system permease protein
MIASGMGDFSYGFLSYALSGSFTWDGLLRFVLAVILGAIIFTAFFILLQSFAFWFGMIANFVGLAFNALITFGIYPTTLFDNYAKLILFTLIPAALVGAVPAEFIVSHTWQSLAQMLIGAVVFLILAITLFNVGLKRYESGSAIQTEV